MKHQSRSTKTYQKIIVLLQAQSLPISLGELHSLLKVSFPQTAFSTVFRLIQKLEKDKKVIRVDWRERGGRFEWADRPHHHHITCQVCGKTQDVDHTVLAFDEQNIAQQTGFLVSHHYFELEGICSHCQNK